jgi:deoxyribonuclease-4
MPTPRIGAHFHIDNPLKQATAIGADAAQFFLGDPQDWKPPVIAGDPAEISQAWAGADIDVYIHSPYPVNLASTNNRIRHPSRTIVKQQLKAAASIGAKALVVHGGHVTAKDDPQDGLLNWAKAVDQIPRPIPLLIENTAGGDGAMFRSLDNIARLWDVVGGADNIGFCLDTCHANSAGIELAEAVEKIMAITGRIDLVHCNNSRDAFDSGQDRHADIEQGTIAPELLLGVVRAANAPAICETPDFAADVRFLKTNLSGALSKMPPAGSSMPAARTTSRWGDKTSRTIQAASKTTAASRNNSAPKYHPGLSP